MRKTSVRLPVRKKLTPMKPWISNGILRSIRTRDKLWLKVRADPKNIRARHKFNRYRNMLRECLREAERKYLERSLRATQGSRASWGVIIHYIRGKSRKRDYPSFLSGESVPVSDLNSANAYFAETGQRVA